MNKKIIEVKNISKTFSLNKPHGFTNLFKKSSNAERLQTIKALDNISFSVQKGEILGIVGLNGSGKTTLLRVIAGVYRPDSGSVQVEGKLSPLMQLGAGFQADLNASENIIMNGMLLGLSKGSIEKKVGLILEYAELQKFSNMKIKHFSSGMRSRLAFSTAMQIDPDILLVDEILSVGDKFFREKSYETFSSLKKEKKTILHSTHNLSKLAEFSDRVLLIHRGQNVMIGNPEEVIKRYENIKSMK